MDRLDKYIDQLPELSSLDGTEYSALRIGGETFKYKLSNLPKNGVLTNSLTNTKIFVGNSSNIATQVNLTLSITPGSFSLANTGILTFPNASGSIRGLLSSTDWTTFNNKQSPLTISTGLTNTSGTVTNNLLTGLSGSQTINGGTGVNENLVIRGTTNTTKTTSYVLLQDNGGLTGIGITTPTASLHIKGLGNTSSTFSLKIDDSTNNPLFYIRNDGTIGIGTASFIGPTGATNFILSNSVASFAQRGNDFWFFDSTSAVSGYIEPDIATGQFDFGSFSNHPLIFVTHNAERARLDTLGNFGIGGSSFGSGQGSIFLGNTSVVPSTNPALGGLIYIEAGALKYRGSSGTVTVLGIA